MLLKNFFVLFMLAIYVQPILRSTQQMQQQQKQDLKSQIENLLSNYHEKQNRNLVIKQDQKKSVDKKRKLNEAKAFAVQIQNKLRKLMPENFNSVQANDFEDFDFINQLIGDVGLAMSQNQDEIMVDPNVFHLMIKYLAVLQHLRQDQTHDENLQKLQNKYKKNQNKIAGILKQLEEADKELQTIKGYKKQNQQKQNNEATEEIENKKQMLLQQLQHAQIQNNFEKEQEDIQKIVENLQQGEEQVSKEQISAKEKLEQIKQLQNEKKKLLKLEELVKERVKAYKTVEDIEDRIENIDSKMSDLIQKGIHPDKINNLESQKQELLGVLYKEKQMLEQKRDYYKLLNDQELFEVQDDQKNKKIQEIKQSKEFKKFQKDMNDLSQLENQNKEKKINFDSYLTLDSFLKKIEEVQQEYKTWFDILEQDKSQIQDQDEQSQFKNDLNLYSKMVDFSKKMNETQKNILQILQQLYDSWNDFDIGDERATIKFYELEDEYNKIKNEDILSEESEEDNSEILNRKKKQLQRQDQQTISARESLHNELNQFINRQGDILKNIKLIIEYNTQLAESINDFLLVKENEDHLNAQNLIFQSQKYHQEILDQKAKIEENLILLKANVKEMIFQRDFLNNKINKVYEAIQNQSLKDQQNGFKIKMIFSIILILLFQINV